MRPLVLRLTFVLLMLGVAAGSVRGQTPPIPSAPKIAEALQPFVDRGALAGAVVVVAAPDKVLSVDTAGYADVAAKAPIKADSVFWIASQSKPITAAALMILVDEGKVKLDDPVVKFLPEFRNLWVVAERDKDHLLLKRPKREITVRDVLSHTSGMPFKSDLEEPTLDRLPLRDRVRSYAMTPLIYQPGEGYQYSNAGINTAGRIIEVVSKMPYEQFLQERLFDPLGMKDATFWPNASQIARIAKSYRPDKDKKTLVETPIGQLQYPLDDHERQPMPAGGLFATADDMRRFCQMLLNHGTFEGKRILSEAAVTELSHRQTPPNLKESYGLGFAVGGDEFGHGGAHATNMSINTKDKLIFIWMIQHAGFPLDGDKAQGAARHAANQAFAGR